MGLGLCHVLSHCVKHLKLLIAPAAHLLGFVDACTGSPARSSGVEGREDTPAADHQDKYT
jgi:hypothetical protein